MRPFFEWVVIMLLALSMSTPAFARPVSYAGGWTLIETSNRASSAALLHYTPAYNYSVGARYEWMRGTDIRMQVIQPTYLAKRWFGKDYQANLYLTGGIGRAERTRGQSSITETASFAGVMADVLGGHLMRETQATCTLGSWSKSIDENISRKPLPLRHSFVFSKVRLC